MSVFVAWAVDVTFSVKVVRGGNWLRPLDLKEAFKFATLLIWYPGSQGLFHKALFPYAFPPLEKAVSTNKLFESIFTSSSHRLQQFFVLSISTNSFHSQDHNHLVQELWFDSRLVDNNEHISGKQPSQFSEAPAGVEFSITSTSMDTQKMIQNWRPCCLSVASFEELV